MDGDWLKLYRKMADSAVMSDDWLCRLWVFLMLRCNWKKSWFKGQAIEVGQMVYAERTLADRLNVSRGKLRRGISMLEKLGQITRQAGPQFSVITLCNFESYQGRSTTDSTARSTTDSTACSTANSTSHKKGKKERREEGKSIRRFTPPSLEQVVAYCTERNNGIDAQRFVDHYAARGWRLKDGNPMKDWQAAIRTWEGNGFTLKNGKATRKKDWTK